MARLIDADALIEILRKSHEYHANSARDVSLLSRDIRLVNESPTVDAQPVVHGRWENNGEDDEWVCSNCRGGQFCYDFTPEEFGLHYCPNCGAKMDLEVNE